MMMFLKIIYHYALFDITFKQFFNLSLICKYLQNIMKNKFYYLRIIHKSSFLEGTYKYKLYNIKPSELNYISYNNVNINNHIQ